MVNVGFSGLTIYNTIAYFLDDRSVLKNKNLISISKWTNDDEYDVISENLFQSFKSLDV